MTTSSSIEGSTMHLKRVGTGPVQNEGVWVGKLFKEDKKYDLYVIECFEDNYGFIIRGRDRPNELISFDAPDGVKVGNEANRMAIGGDSGGTLHVLVTHGHHDHVGGMGDLIELWCNGGEGRKVKVYGPADARCVDSVGDKHEYVTVKGGSVLSIAGNSVEVLDTTGHTCPHLSFHIPELKFCMTGDSLFSLGCGRVFEGTMNQMYEAMGKYEAIGGDTWIACSHEYTLANARYMRSLGGSEGLDERIREVEELRERGAPSVPVTMEVSASRKTGERGE